MAAEEQQLRQEAAPQLGSIESIDQAVLSVNDDPF